VTKIRLNEFMTLEITLPPEANITQFKGLFRRLQAVERLFEGEDVAGEHKRVSNGDVKDKIISLRKEGKGNKEIAETLGIKVAKVSNILWMAKKNGEFNG